MKKLLVLLIAAVMLVAMVACQTPGNNPTTSTNGVTNGATDSASETASLEIPEVTYDGADFGIVTRGGDWQKDIFVEGTVEEQSDIVSSAVIERNQRIADKFDVNMVFYAHPGDDLETLVLADDDTYQIMIPAAQRSFTGIVEGLYVEWGQLPYVDLSKPWWYQDAVETFTIGGNLYNCLSDFTFNNVQCTACVYFNRDLLDNLGVDEDIYDLVKSGAWTWDKMASIAKLGSADLDKDDELYIYFDQYGYVTQLWGGPMTCLFSQGGSISAKDENDYPYLTVGSEKNETIITSFIENIYDQDWSYVKDGVEVRESFSQGRAIFCEENLGVATLVFRFSDVDYGIVPPPKYDEDQAEYRTVINAATNITVVPKSNKRLEMTSILMEYLAADSHENVLPVYYETALKQKGTQDDTAIEMIELIRKSVSVDLVAYMGNCAGLDCIGVAMLMGNSRNFYSYYDANVEAANLSIQNYINMFKENAS